MISDPDTSKPAGARATPNHVLNMVHGWPDDQRITASITASGQLGISRDGTPSFLDQVGTARPFEDVWLGPGTPDSTMFTPRPTVNYIADADLCAKALQAAVTLSQSFAVPWFNHPRAVARNTREQVARDLRGIPHLEVPRTIRIKAATTAEVEDAIAAAGMSYPVILRVPGMHDGKTTIRVADAAAITPACLHLGLSRDLYATEFVDYRSPDGHYRKYRVAVIGGRPTLRHLIIGSQWLLSAGNRLAGPAVAAEERAALQRPVETLSPHLERQVAAIHTVVGLDYFGIDCSIRPDGTLLLFEANASMSILANSFLSPNMWDAPIARCTAHLLTLLDQPDRWVHGSVLVRGQA